MKASGRKALLQGNKKMKVPCEEGSANFVPAAAVRRGILALLGIIGRKEGVGGLVSQV